MKRKQYWIDHKSQLQLGIELMVLPFSGVLFAWCSYMVLDELVYTRQLLLYAADNGASQDYWRWLGMALLFMFNFGFFGIISILFSHRITGAAYSIKQSIKKMINGDLRNPIKLRNNDYLHDVAELINQLEASFAEDIKMINNDVAAMKSLLDANDNAIAQEKLVAIQACLEKYQIADDVPR